MANYFNNLKWVISGHDAPICTNEINKNENQNQNQNQNQHTLTNTNTNTELDNANNIGFVSESESESELELDEYSDADSEHEYHKIKPDINSAKENYNEIYSYLLEQEQLVREKLDPDTVEKIKENYIEYMNSDVQIIKDFAIVMDTFVHIKEKLISLENNIKEFSDDINKTKTIHYENISELDNKFNQIDTELIHTIKMVTGIKKQTDEFMDKIVHLENSIKQHDVHREEFCLKLEGFTNEHFEMKKNNIKFLSIFTDFQKYMVFSNCTNNSSGKFNKYQNFTIGISSILILSGIGLGSWILFGNKFFKKN